MGHEFSGIWINSGMHLLKIIPHFIILAGVFICVLTCKKRHVSMYGSCVYTHTAFHLLIVRQLA